MSEDSSLPDLPDWVFKFRSLEDVRNWVLGIIVTSVVAVVLAVWDAILGGVMLFWSTLAWAWTMIGDAFGQAFSPMYWVFDGLEWASDFITEAALSMGLFAPLAVIAGWAIPIVIVAVLLNFVLGFLGTYLPLKGLPVVGRFFR